MSSLFHDIGYPFELPFEQVCSYFEVEGDKRESRPFVAYHDLDAFLKDVDLVVIMVGHKQLRDNIDVLKGKIIFDTRNVCPKGLGVYKL